MALKKVPLYQKPLSFVTVDPEATKGAVVGANLWAANGALIRLEDILNPSPSESPDEPGQSFTYWRLIMEIPPNVVSVAELATSGFVRRDAMGAWTASAILNPDLSSANTDGLAEGATNLYFTDARAVAAVEAAGISGSSEILIQDGSSAPPVMLTNEAEDDFLYGDS